MNKICAIIIAISLALFGSTVFAKVNINTSDARELAEEMSGVGLSKARAIVSYREKHGSFKTIDELTQVKGIGQKTIDQNRDKLMVGEQSEGEASNSLKQ